MRRSAGDPADRGRAGSGGRMGEGPMKPRHWLLVLAMLTVPALAHAQSVNIDLGAAGEAGATARIVQLTALITVLSLAPSLLVMMTAFTGIIIVLSLLRSAL